MSAIQRQKNQHQQNQQNNHSIIKSTKVKGKRHHPSSSPSSHCAAKGNLSSSTKKGSKMHRLNGGQFHYNSPSKDLPSSFRPKGPPNISIYHQQQQQQKQQQQQQQQRKHYETAKQENLNPSKSNPPHSHTQNPRHKGTSHYQHYGNFKHEYYNNNQLNEGSKKGHHFEYASSQSSVLMMISQGAMIGASSRVRDHECVRGNGHHHNSQQSHLQNHGYLQQQQQHQYQQQQQYKYYQHRYYGGNVNDQTGIDVQAQEDYKKGKNVKNLKNNSYNHHLDDDEFDDHLQSNVHITWDQSTNKRRNQSVEQHIYGQQHNQQQPSSNSLSSSASISASDLQPRSRLKKLTRQMRHTHAVQLKKSCENSNGFGYLNSRMPMNEYGQPLKPKSSNKQTDQFSSASVKSKINTYNKNSIPKNLNTRNHVNSNVNPSNGNKKSTVIKHHTQQPINWKSINSNSNGNSNGNSSKKNYTTWHDDHQNGGSNNRQYPHQPQPRQMRKSNPNMDQKDKDFLQLKQLHRNPNRKYLNGQRAGTAAVGNNSKIGYSTINTNIEGKENSRQLINRRKGDDIGSGTGVYQQQSMQRMQNFQHLHHQPQAREPIPLGALKNRNQGAQSSCMSSSGDSQLQHTKKKASLAQTAGSRQQTRTCIQTSNLTQHKDSISAKSSLQHAAISTVIEKQQKKCQETNLSPSLHLSSQHCSSASSPSRLQNGSKLIAQDKECFLQCWENILVPSSTSLSSSQSPQYPHHIRPPQNHYKQPRQFRTSKQLQAEKQDLAPMKSTTSLTVDKSAPLRKSSGVHHLRSNKSSKSSQNRAKDQGSVKGDSLKPLSPASIVSSNGKATDNHQHQNQHYYTQHLIIPAAVNNLKNKQNSSHQSSNQCSHHSSPQSSCSSPSHDPSLSPFPSPAQLLQQFQESIPQINANFEHDSLSYMQGKDRQLTQSENFNCYLERHGSLDWKKRAIIIDWMCEVLAEIGGKRETLGSSVNLFDRYLSLTRDIKSNRLQCLAVACMLIAAKLEDKSLTPRYLSEATLNTYTAEDIRQTEWDVTATLGFRLNTPTLNTWANRLATQWDAYLEVCTDVVASYPLIQRSIEGIKFKSAGDEKSYFNFRQLCQYVDFAVMDLYTLRYQPRMISLAFIYIIMVLKLGLYKKQEVVSTFPYSSMFLLESSELNDFFYRFLKDSFNIEALELLPMIQYCATFVILPLKFDLPQVVRDQQSNHPNTSNYNDYAHYQEEDASPMHYQEFCCYQTRNQSMIRYLGLRCRDII